MIKRLQYFSGPWNKMYNHVEINSIRGFDNQRKDKKTVPDYIIEEYL